MLSSWINRLFGFEIVFGGFEVGWIDRFVGFESKTIRPTVQLDECESAEDRVRSGPPGAPPPGQVLVTSALEGGSFRALTELADRTPTSREQAPLALFAKGGGVAAVFEEGESLAFWAIGVLCCFFQCRKHFSEHD